MRSPRTNPTFFLVLSSAFAVAIVVVLFRFRVAPTSDDDGRIRVAATIYPLAEFARQVGGDAVVVETLTPAGVEPHDFEPSPRAVASIADADFVIVNGGGIDAWAERLVPTLKTQGVEVIVATNILADRTITARADEAFGEADEVSGVDPHVWLHPTLAQRIVREVHGALVALDPDHAATYAARAATLSAELAALDGAYRDGLASCERRVVVASHAAFAYLADAYGFELLPIAGLSPDAEPSAGGLAALADVARARGVRHVFFETLVSPALAEALAREIGAETLVFNPIEGLTDGEIAAGASYLSLMRENLANLRTAMVCQ